MVFLNHNGGFNSKMGLLCKKWFSLSSGYESLIKILYTNMFEMAIFKMTAFVQEATDLFSFFIPQFGPTNSKSFPMNSRSYPGMSKH